MVERTHMRKPVLLDQSRGGKTFKCRAYRSGRLEKYKAYITYTLHDEKFQLTSSCVKKNRVLEVLEEKLNE